MFQHFTNQITFSPFRYVVKILKEKYRIMEDINDINFNILLTVHLNIFISSYQPT